MVAPRSLNNMRGSSEHCENRGSCMPRAPPSNGAIGTSVENVRHRVRYTALEAITREQPKTTEQRTNFAKANRTDEHCPRLEKQSWSCEEPHNPNRRKQDDRWDTGTNLGLVEQSNTLLIGTTRGVFKSKLVHERDFHQFGAATLRSRNCLTRP